MTPYDWAQLMSVLSCACGLGLLGQIISGSTVRELSPVHDVPLQEAVLLVHAALIGITMAAGLAVVMCGVAYYVLYLV